MTTHELELKPFPPHRKSPLTSRSPFTSRVEPGFVVLREKHKYMNWIKLDAGSAEPITINLTEQQQDNYGDLLEGLAPNNQLKVTVVRNEAGKLAIDTLDEAPALAARLGLGQHTFWVILLCSLRSHHGLAPTRHDP